MTYRIIDAAAIEAGRGPHPAASPFDRRVGEALGLRAFELYQVELPPGAETVLHDHLEDGTEDAYAFIRGSGWVIVDGNAVPVEPGHFVCSTGLPFHLREPCHLTWPTGGRWRGGRSGAIGDPRLSGAA